MSNENPANDAPQHTEEKAKTIGHYILSKSLRIFTHFIFKGKTIGEGTFGKVKLSTHTLTGEKVSFSY